MSRMQAWLQLGLCLMSLGDLTQSVAALTQATKLEPKLQEAWFGLAHCQKEVGHVLTVAGAILAVPGSCTADSLPVVHQVMTCLYG